MYKTLGVSFQDRAKLEVTGMINTRVGMEKLQREDANSSKE